MDWLHLTLIIAIVLMIAERSRLEGRIAWAHLKKCEADSPSIPTSGDVRMKFVLMTGSEFLPVVIALEELGMCSPEKAVFRAASKGTSSEELFAIIDHFKAYRELYSWRVGALNTRISRHIPGLPVECGWPESNRLDTVSGY